MSDQDKKDDPLFSYFNLSDAIDEVKTELNIGDGAGKTRASAKLFGKTLFNVGLLAGKIGAGLVKNAPAIMARHADHAQRKIDETESLSQEQRQNIQDKINKMKNNL